jgi:hypothetical protein
LAIVGLTSCDEPSQDQTIPTPAATPASRAAKAKAFSEQIPSVSPGPDAIQRTSPVPRTRPTIAPRKGVMPTPLPAYPKQ